MRIFLLWQRTTNAGRALRPEEVAVRIQDIFSPLFATSPDLQVEQNQAAALVFLHFPVEGWKAPFVQEDRGGRVFAADYPVTARRVLAAKGIPFREHAVLPSLARALRDEPEGTLQELAPPFSLIWFPQGEDIAFLQLDGLAQTQCFEYDDGQLWAATNKITALKAIGIPLDLDPVDWAAKSTFGWFPTTRSGYRRVRYSAPGMQIRLDLTGRHQRSVDVLSEWVHPDPLAHRDALELARCSLIQHIKDGEPNWERPACGLTGGWDTRAVVSSLIAAGADFSVKVKGLEGKYDVQIARKLSKIANLDLQVKEKAQLPPERTPDLERCISLALLWQTGHMWSENVKSFLWNKGYLDGGMLNLMGQHGEIGRGHYERRVRAWEVEVSGYEDRLVWFLTKDMLPYIHRGLQDQVRELARDIYRQAGHVGLSGAAALDFAYLFERTRRYNGASVASQSGLVFTPFLNPDFIRATYAYRAAGGLFVRDEEQINPLHRYIIETNTPEWASIEYEDAVVRAARKLKRQQSGDAVPQPDLQLEWQRSPGKEYYNYDLYWREVGKPIVERITSVEGFWTEVFDPDLVRASEEPPPIEVVMPQLVVATLEQSGATVFPLREVLPTTKGGIR